ncbi:MAG: RagB/SusD family nutrient uptake outer membrane protein [Candidatus Pseudobacter hemicellulosilyticus]|uniref:RagB/SusD family nutrient uptake outer membrane protein n=1 Tax=Candidatus Pseudobacter hemicellulosilyticus TaxID=3121375 RepID=A0AAJ6BKD4_9BACT|nr:MAG: RagB/SusD family nutrient uptake outer membrane protein [Pseudobacter sp.]
MSVQYNRTIIAAVTCAFIGLTGCSKDFLDTRLDTQPVQHNVDGSYSSLIQLANAPYAYLQQRNEFSSLDGNLFAAVTDEAVQTNSVGDVYLFNNGNWNQFNNPDDRYNYYYAGIYSVNYFLEYLQKNGGNYRAMLAINRDTITADTRLTYLNDVALMGYAIPEAHVLRAYFYFELIKRYGGVPLLTQTYSASDKPAVSMSGFDELVNFIVTEIDTYKNSLQPNWKTSDFTNQDGRFTIGAALALKARVLLYAASPLHNAAGSATKWQAAAAAANEALVFAQRADAAGGRNSLDGNYRNYFLGNNTLTSNETILAIRYAASNDLERANYPIATAGGNSGVTPTDDLVKAYELTGAAVPDNPYANRDPRLGFTIVTNGSTWNSRVIDQSPGGTDDMRRVNASKTGYYLKKFMNDNVDLVNNAVNPHNWPVFRYGELLLVYAEAMNEAYGPDNNNGFVLTAREALNQVRARPGVNLPGVIAAGQTEFRAAVKQERRVELAFENHRYWDLVRWGDAATVQSRAVTGVQVTKNTSGAFVYTPKTVQNRVFLSPKMNYYPFPQSEVNISNGVLIQNAGW